MIKKLEEFTEIWNLTVNLEKSKIVVFRKNRGRLKRTERWYYKGHPVEIVNNYKYLGVTLTAHSQFNTHLDERGRVAKKSINSIWSKVFMNEHIPISSKCQIFNTIVLTSLCYGCEVWGYKLYEQLEKIQRFFLKKMLRIPKVTPNYILYLETEQSDFL